MWAEKIKRFYSAYYDSDSKKYYCIFNSDKPGAKDYRELYYTRVNLDLDQNPGFKANGCLGIYPDNNGKDRRVASINKLGKDKNVIVAAYNDNPYSWVYCNFMNGNDKSYYYSMKHNAKEKTKDHGNIAGLNSCVYFRAGMTPIVFIGYIRNSKLYLKACSYDYGTKKVKSHSATQTADGYVDDNIAGGSLRMMIVNGKLYLAYFRKTGTQLSFNIKYKPAWLLSNGI